MAYPNWMHTTRYRVPSTSPPHGLPTWISGGKSLVGQISPGDTCYTRVAAIAQVRFAPTTLPVRCCWTLQARPLRQHPARYHSALWVPFSSPTSGGFPNIHSFWVKPNRPVGRVPSWASNSFGLYRCDAPNLYGSVLGATWGPPGPPGATPRGADFNKTCAPPRGTEASKVP